MGRREIRVVGAMLQNDEGRYLITQRRPEGSLPLLWEFPGGRVEEGESPEQALARELKEDLGIIVAVGERAMHTRHAYPHYDVDFCVFHCRPGFSDQTVRHDRVNDHRWVTLEEMSGYQFPDADAKTLAKLLGLEEL
jgi:8-oxo-dGTP diphosphatase